MMNHWLSC